MVMGKFNSYAHCIYYCGPESLRRNGDSSLEKKKGQNSVLGYNLKNDRMISTCFQGKSLNITVIQVYVSTTDAKEAESDQFYEDLQYHTPKKSCPFHHRGCLKCKGRMSRATYLE